MRAIAEAHPNIALVKYWGKQDVGRNLPAVGSVSITLDTLRTRTELSFDSQADADTVCVDGKADPATTARVVACLDRFRRSTGWSRHARVDSESNFPAAAGLASSASGFAALVVAADGAAGTGLSRLELARLAGAASGSAARSVHGGFVALELPTGNEEEISVQRLAPPDHWPLEVVIAVTDPGPKPVGSTEAMLASEATSPYYRRWVEEQPADLDEAVAAIAARDFEHLADISEYSCLKMHALTLSARPGILYWKPATLACLQAVRRLRGEGHGVFFTVDAGPQVKAICLPGSAGRVAEEFAAIPEVCRVLRAGPGGEARVLETA